MKTFSGFKKKTIGDGSVLLAGGGDKALSEFKIGDYLPIAQVSEEQATNSSWGMTYAESHRQSLVYNTSGREWAYWIGMRSSDTSYGTILRLSHDGLVQYAYKSGGAAGENWNGWTDILTANNYSNYALPKAGGELTGALTIKGVANSGAYSQGGYNANYSNIILKGDPNYGVSGITFLSYKGDTNINQPSDVGFILYHAHGMTPSDYPNDPTEANSGERTRLVIGVGNDADNDSSDYGEQLWLLTPGGNDLKHLVGTTLYNIITSRNIGSQSVNYSTYSTYSDLAYRLRSTDQRYEYPNTVLPNYSSVNVTFSLYNTLGISGDYGTYYDVMAISSYADSSGGNENAIIFSKNGSSVFHTLFSPKNSSSWGTAHLFLDSNNYTTYTYAKTDADNKFVDKQITSIPNGTGWYRIAETSTYLRASWGTFNIFDLSTGLPCIRIILASLIINRPGLVLINGAEWANTISKARIVHASAGNWNSANKAYFEIYTTAGNYDLKSYFSGYGWNCYSEAINVSEDISGVNDELTVLTLTNNGMAAPVFSGTVDWSNITNKPFTGTTFNSGDNSNHTHDCNEAWQNGVYYYWSNGPSTSLGASTGDGALYVLNYSSDWVAQIAQDYRNGSLFVRGKNSGTWQSWKRIIDSDNIGSQSVNYANSAGSVLWTGVTSQMNGGNEFNITDYDYPYASFWINYLPRSQRSSNPTELTNYYLGNLQGGYSKLTTSGFIHASYNSSSYLLRSDGGADHENTWQRAVYSTQRDFPDGTLIYTDIPYNVVSGDPFYLEIRGNVYGRGYSCFTQAQGYIWDNGIINYGVSHLGICPITGLIAMLIGENLCFWFPRQEYWEGYSITVNSAYDYRVNRVTNVVNSADPGGTKRVDLAANTISNLNTSNFSSNIDYRYLRKDASDSTPYQYTFSKIDDHAIQVGNIRGYGSNGQSGNYLHIYERVHIGSPNGWGSKNAPSYGLSTYGGAWLATDTGNVGIGTESPSEKLHVSGNEYITGYINLNDNGYLASGRSSSFTYGYSFSLGDAGKSMGLYSGADGEEGGLVVSPDTCIIYNSSDTGHNFSVYDKDLGGDLTTSTSLTFDIIGNGDYRAWSRGGFYKNGSDDNYALLGGGGHKALSDFSMIGHTHSYLPLSGGWMNQQAQIGCYTASTDSYYGGALQIRECDGVTTDLSDWVYAPRISFHWGGRAVNSLGMQYDGNLAWGNLVIIHSGNIGSQYVHYSTYTSYPYIVATSTSDKMYLDFSYYGDTYRQLYVYSALSFQPSQKHLWVSGGFDADPTKYDDGNDRPGISITGNYPQLSLISNVNNSSHGAVLSIGAYDTAGATSGGFKTFRIGTRGYDATWLDISYGTHANVHDGIDGWNTSGNGVQIMRFHNNRTVYSYGTHYFGVASHGATYYHSGYTVYSYDKISTYSYTYGRAVIGDSSMWNNTLGVNGTVGIGSDYTTAKLNLPYNNFAINFREGRSYDTGFFYGTYGNEFLALTTQQSVTSLIFGNGYDPASITGGSFISGDGTNYTYGASTDVIQIKQNCVNIGGVWSHNITPDYKLKVNGNTYIDGRTIVNYAATNGTGALQINAGSNSYAYALDIQSSIVTGDILVAFVMGISHGTNNQLSGLFKYVGSGSTSNLFGFGFYGNDFLLNIRADGNVGIGCTDPAQKLDVNGSIILRQSSAQRNAGIIGYYDYTHAAAIWSMGSAYQIASDGTSLGNLYGAAYAYEYQYGTASRLLAGGHQFIWADNGDARVALGYNGVWAKEKVIAESNSARIIARAASDFSYHLTLEANYDWSWPWAISGYGATIMRGYYGTAYINLGVSGQNVGIGTDTPTSKLEVNGNATATGFIKSGSNSWYVLTGDGGHVHRNNIGNSTTASAITSLDINYNFIYATISADATLGLSAAMSVGQVLTVLVYNSGSASITITVPSGWSSLDGSTISCSANKFLEISILCYASGNYLVSAKGQ